MLVQYEFFLVLNQCIILVDIQMTIYVTAIITLSKIQRWNLVRMINEWFFMYGWYDMTAILVKVSERYDFFAKIPRNFWETILLSSKQPCKCVFTNQPEL